MPPDKPNGEGGGVAKAAPCPICRRPASDATRPFCSPRCRDVDLNRWLTGSYVVPGSEDDSEDSE